MRRLLACVVMVVAIVAGLRAPGVPTWAVVLGLAAVGALAWRLSICPHAGPLSLLPATTTIAGDPLPARWYCDACGRTWPARFDRPQTPKQIFTGHDESKATAAAKRAAEHEERQRVLALQRAGLGKSAIITDASEFQARKAGGK